MFHRPAWLWMDKCVFRKNRYEKAEGFSTWELEVEALQKSLVAAVAKA
jgi:hypothetical protein